MADFLFIGLSLIVWCLPLPFGGNIEWAIYGFETSVFILFVIFLLRPGGLTGNWEASEWPEKPERVLPLFFSILIGIFFLVLLAQIVPLPSKVVKILSPAAWKWREELVFSGLMGTKTFKWQTISLSPWASAYELVRYLSYGVFAFLLAKVVNSQKKARALALILVSAGVFQALYGLSEYFGGTNRIFSWVNPHYSGSAFGTFVNRDHYSAFLEMTFPLSLGYFLVKANYFSLRPGLTLRQKITAFGQENLQKSLLFILPPLIIGTGLFFSRCRSGIIIFVVSFFTMLLALSLTAVSGPSRTEKRLVKVVVVSVILCVVLIGITPILERFTYGGFFDKNRLLVYSYTLRLIGQYLWLGSGSGTYIQAITPFLQKDFYVIFDHAHNDYLEMIAETGLVGGGIIILVGFLTLGLGFRRWSRAKDPLARGVGLGALIGVSALFFHSLTDFSLRMPGNAVFWLSLFVLGLKLPWLVSGNNEQKFREEVGLKRAE
ncbi:MAG: O-antigen ligase family protein [Candidatus Saccharicenans sp.]|nr:MAG: hypothetical protein C0168_00415 [Candidatus Aminicenantes bacterium]HEK86599.1 hypothetical protein [Candidatus Aminicenantes bacterium]